MLKKSNLERSIGEDLDIQKSFWRGTYMSDVILASGVGIGATGLLTEAYTLVLVGGYAFVAGLSCRCIQGYVHNRINSRQNPSNSQPSLPKDREAWRTPLVQELDQE